MEDQKVMVDATLFKNLIEIFKDMRTLVILCSPKFSSGSRGEIIFNASVNSINLINEIENQIKGKAT